MQKLWLQLDKKYAPEPVMPPPPSSIVPTNQSRRRRPPVVPPPAEPLVYRRARCSLEGRHHCGGSDLDPLPPRPWRHNPPRHVGRRAPLGTLWRDSLRPLTPPPRADRPLCGHARRRKSSEGMSQGEETTHTAHLSPSPSLPPSSRWP